jgi:hypothetical protein
MAEAEKTETSVYGYVVQFVPESNMPWTLVQDARSPEGIHAAFAAARREAFGPKGKGEGSLLFLGSGSFLVTAIQSVSLFLAVGPEAAGLAEIASRNLKRDAEAEAIRRGDVDSVDEEEDDDDLGHDDDDDKPTPAFGRKVPQGLASIGS